MALAVGVARPVVGAASGQAGAGEEGLVAARMEEE